MTPDALATEALARWGLEETPVTLVAERENHVFQVVSGTDRFALRLHRQGYCSPAELASELAWMAALGDGGLGVPQPVPTNDGALFCEFEGRLVDMLTWLPGSPLGQTGTPLDVADRTGLFHRLGQSMADLHLVSDNWAPPSGFTRRAWDWDGLVGETPVWGRFWENPTLGPSDKELFEELRDRLRQDLDRLVATLDYGMIHADLVRENVLVDGGALYLIDFDDSGFGFRLFDLATILLRNRNEPDFSDLKDALIAGYHSRRALDVAALDLFLLIRATTYAGWIVPRMSEPGSAERNNRFIQTIKDLAVPYLENSG